MALVPSSFLRTGGIVRGCIRNLRQAPSANQTEEWGSRGKGADYFSKLRRLLAKMGPDEQKLILYMAQKVARH
jgi:hypothetical protein